MATQRWKPVCLDCWQERQGYRPTPTGWYYCTDCGTLADTVDAHPDYETADLRERGRLRDQRRIEAARARLAR